MKLEKQDAIWVADKLIDYFNNLVELMITFVPENLRE